eukprot:gnl/Dysnectes_brevis/5082_a7154_389.p1 GENE.gnl/Dysnectes_brevis/5082_a7154_389~~gnl/Dysnectes_brevis/5082_a7154_389.p1  ORF type:complete len:447 (+),score=127.06 gnl/Dysnectes_brevis/5082_a7154_389:1348-2688(+)
MSSPVLLEYKPLGNITCVRFSPSEESYRLALGMESGELIVFDLMENIYDEESTVPLSSRTPYSPDELISVMAHDGPVRDLIWSSDGELLYSIGRDGILSRTTVPDGEVTLKQQGLRPHPLTRMCWAGEDLIAIGDQEGYVTLWNPALPKAKRITFGDAGDYISGLAYSPLRKVLFATSGDGTLYLYGRRDLGLKRRFKEIGDVPRNTKGDHWRLLDNSSPEDEDLTSLTLSPGGQHALAGTSTGGVAVYKMPNIAMRATVVKPRTGSVDSVTHLAGGLFVVGCEDGTVRACAMDPPRLIGMIGRAGRFALGLLGSSADCAVLACGAVGGEVLKLLDVSWMFPAEDEESDESDGKEVLEEEEEDPVHEEPIPEWTGVVDDADHYPLPEDAPPVEEVSESNSDALAGMDDLFAATEDKGDEDVALRIKRRCISKDKRHSEKAAFFGDM